MNDKELDIVLNHVGKAAEYEVLFRDMCSYYLSLMEGDTHHIEKAYALMKEHGIVDEDGFEV